MTRSADHVGISVPDLDAAVRCFVDVLGFEELYRHAPVHPAGDTQARQFGRHPETRVVGIAMLRLGELRVELLEYSAPDQRREMPRTSDWGGTHLAFRVDDLDAAVEHLRAHGVHVLGEPMPLPDAEAGPGNRFVFALLPGDIPIELVTYPEGRPA